MLKNTKAAIISSLYLPLVFMRYKTIGSNTVIAVITYPSETLTIEGIGNDRTAKETPKISTNAKTLSHQTLYNLKMK